MGNEAGGNLGGNGDVNEVVDEVLHLRVSVDRGGFINRIKLKFSRFGSNNPSSWVYRAN